MPIDRRLVGTIGMIVLLFVSGCRSGSQPVKPTTQAAPVTGTVYVREFNQTGTKVASFEAPTTGFGLEVAQKIADHLREGGVQAEVIARNAPVPSGTVVDGDVTLIDGGSRAARYWAGFGAGATRFAVVGKVVDASGKTIGEFADERRSGFGLFGGDSESLMHKCVDSVGADVATMVSSGQYQKTF